MAALAEHWLSMALRKETIISRLGAASMANDGLPGYMGHDARGADKSLMLPNHWLAQACIT